MLLKEHEKEKTVKKKFITFLLAVILIFSAAPGVYADGGTCGDDVTWDFDEETGVLTLGGRGDMSDYEYPAQSWSGQPWRSYMDEITSVVVEPGVTYIGEFAFSSCENLKTLVLNSGIKSIGAYSFFRCTSLQSVSIPATVRVIGNYAFCRCNAMETLTIERGVSTVGSGAFSYCSSLKKVEMPASIASLGGWVFSDDTSLREATVGSGLQALPNGTFANCQELESVFLPASVTRICASAFCNCTSLKTVNYGGSEKGWGNVVSESDNDSLSGAAVVCTGSEADDPSIPETPDPGTNPEPVYSEPFDDVADKDWFVESVKFVYTKGIMSGQSAKIFNPGQNASREVIVVALWRLDGCKELKGTIRFRDVKENTEAEKAVAWATENGIVTGYEDGTFRPDNAVTRQELATLFYRYAKYVGEPVRLLADISGYEDHETVASYAQTPVRWAVARGLINGMTTTTLVPKGTSTRAQLAVMIDRFCNAAVG